MTSAGRARDARHIARYQEHAGADRVTDDNRRRGPKAEAADQAGVFGMRMRIVCHRNRIPSVLVTRCRVNRGKT